MGEPGQVERGRIAMGRSRDARNAVHMEAIALALQASVRLKGLQLELQERALEIDMGDEWREFVTKAVDHGTAIDLPLSESPEEPAEAKLPGWAGRFGG